MFTGLVEAQGKITSTEKNSSSYRIRIECPFAEELTLGESVAVNGICLTVSQKDTSSFFADISPETQSRTSLAQATSCPVNLERAMKADGRFGGHIVSGHIDGTAKFLGSRKDANSFIIKIQAQKNIAKFIIEKGSVSIDGISLTVASVGHSANGCVFTVAVIPHTWENTNLKHKRPGNLLNIECDLVGKYIAHFVDKKNGEEYGMQSLWKY